MGNICSNSSESYFETLFKQSLIRKLSDRDYVNFIDNYLRVKYTGDSQTLKPNFGMYPNQFQSLKDVLFQSMPDESPESSGSLKAHLLNRNVDISDYKEDLLKQIFSKLIISTVRIKEQGISLDKLDKSSVGFLNHMSNSYYQKIKALMKGKEEDLIVIFLFLTNNSLETVCQSLNYLMKLLKGKTIIRKENSQLYINIKSICEYIKLFIRLFTQEAIEHASYLLEEGESSFEFTSSYKLIFGKETIDFYVEQYLDFTFIEESSLAYFIKMVYPTINSPESAVRSLSLLYRDLKEKLDFASKERIEKIVRELASLERSNEASSPYEKSAAASDTDNMTIDGETVNLTKDHEQESLHLFKSASDECNINPKRSDIILGKHQ